MKTKRLDQGAQRGRPVSLVTVSDTSRSAVMALSLTVFVEGLAAQGIFGRISGTVTDSQGAAVAGAKISIANEDTELTRSTTTDANGY